MTRHDRELGLLAVLVAFGVFVSSASPWFLTADNLGALARHLAEVGIVAGIMTLVVTAGGIDLSVGSLLALCGIVFGYTWPELGALPAAALALAVGAVCGAGNGFLVSNGRLPALVVTLATMALFRGLALGISQGQPVSQLPPGFAGLGQGSLGGAPVQLWVWMAVVGLAGLVTTRLVWGRWVRALGDNELAARHAAVPVGRVQICLYALSGLSSAVAGLIFCARVSTARADAGVGFELEVITAVVLGGTRITGGRGSVSGTLLGVILIGTIRNGLNLLGLASVWQAMVAGAVLVGTAVVNERIALHREMSSA